MKAHLRRLLDTRRQRRCRAGRAQWPLSARSYGRPETGGTTGHGRHEDQAACRRVTAPAAAIARRRFSSEWLPRRGHRRWGIRHDRPRAAAGATGESGGPTPQGPSRSHARKARGKTPREPDRAPTGCWRPHPAAPRRARRSGSRLHAGPGSAACGRSRRCGSDARTVTLSSGASATVVTKGTIAELSGTGQAASP